MARSDISRLSPDELIFLDQLILKNIQEGAELNTPLAFANGVLGNIAVITQIVMQTLTLLEGPARHDRLTSDAEKRLEEALAQVGAAVAEMPSMTLGQLIEVRRRLHAA